MAGLPEVLAGAGAIAVVAAAAGGGLKSTGLDVPVLTSKRSRLLVAFVGIVLMALGFAIYWADRPSTSEAPKP